MALVGRIPREWAAGVLMERVEAWSFGKVGMANNE